MRLPAFSETVLYYTLPKVPGIVILIDHASWQVHSGAVIRSIITLHLVYLLYCWNS